MDRKTRLQCEAALLLINSSDFFTLSRVVRAKRLADFFTTLVLLKNDLERHKVQLDRVREKWTDFHRKLCDAEPDGEYLNCFLSSGLRCDDAFSKHCLFVHKTIVNDGCTGSELFEILETQADRTELIRALKENCHNVPTKVTFKYLNIRVLPAIFSPQTTDEERLELCDLVLAMPMGFSVNFMHYDTQQKYKQAIINKYIPFIYGGGVNVFRRHWTTMCRVLIHHSGKILHIDTQVQNAILKIVEDVFKNACVEDRCAAFDCWQTLIDNYALERNYLTNPKQAALLLKPLRARISRNRIVTAKKYDTYVHLLRTMRFGKEYLEQFFVEAFGPFDDEVPEQLDGDHIRHFKDLAATYSRSTEILLKTLRHDKSTCECANRTLPISDSCGPVNGEVCNWEVLVHSVRLCSQLNYVSLINARGDIIEAITKCLWSTLFKHFQLDTFKDSRAEIMKSIQLAISKVLNCSSMNRTYYDKFFIHILSCVVNFLEGGKFDAQVYEALVQPTIKELIIFQNNFGDKLPEQMHSERIGFLFDYCKADPKFIDFIIGLMESGTYKCHLAAGLLAVAICHLSSTMGKSPSKLDDDTMKQLLTNFISMNIAPWNFARVIDSIQSKPIVLIKLFNRLKDDTAMTSGLFRITSALLHNVALKQTINDHIFYTHLVDVISTCLKYITKERSDPSHAQIISDCTNAYLKVALDLIVQARAVQPSLKVEEQKLLTIYYHLLKFGMYPLLESLSSLLDFVEKQDVPTKLYNLITSLTDHEEEVSQKAFIAFAKIHAKSSSSTSPNMPVNGINLSPKVKILSDLVFHTQSPITVNTVRLFGKSFDSPSPKRCRGSILERMKQGAQVPERRSSTSSVSTGTLRHIDEFSESAFVPIDKQVVMDKEKMSDRQREVTLRRRDDIPAMYQDLTQSRSMEGSDGKMALTPSTNDKVDARVTRSSDTAQKIPTPTSTPTTESMPAAEVEVVKSKKGRKRKQSLVNVIDDSSQAAPEPAHNTTDDKVEHNDESMEEGKSERFKTELSRLRIDCVGGNDIFNLPKSRTRRSRVPGDKMSWYDFEDDSSDRDLGKAPAEAHNDKNDKKNDKCVKKLEQNNCDVAVKKKTKATDKQEKSPKLSDVKEEKVKRGPKKTAKEDAKKTNKVNLNSSAEGKNKDIVKMPEKLHPDLSETTTIEKVTPKEIEECTPENKKHSESDGVIPSSQECNVRVNLFRLPHYSPTKKELDDARNRNEKASLQITSTLMTKIDFSALEGDYQGDETLTMDMDDEPPTDKKLADLDTVSFLGTNASMRLAVEESTPAKATRASTSSLEASPITRDTPSKNKELLNNTQDISPIKAVSEKEASPDLFGSQDAAVDNDVEVEAVVQAEAAATLKNPSWRSVKLLNLVGNLTKMSPARTVVENTRVLAISSPKTDRIRKMMLNCPDSKLPDDQEPPKNYPGDVLEFERAVPSPLALPKSSILKRKVPDSLDDVFSPCAKRKRVNFSDPPTTCEKVYFKVIEEKEKPIALRKKKRFVTRLLTADDAPPEEEQLDIAMEAEGASNAIQSLQDQIDGLEFEGVVPLDSSPPKDTATAHMNGRLSPLPSNPAPELLGKCVPPTSYANLFPSEEPPVQEQEHQAFDAFKDNMFTLLRNSTSLESYLNMGFKDIPISDIEKWVKERKTKQRRAKRRQRKRD